MAASQWWTCWSCWHDCIRGLPLHSSCGGSGRMTAYPLCPCSASGPWHKVRGCKSLMSATSDGASAQGAGVSCHQPLELWGAQDGPTAWEEGAKGWHQEARPPGAAGCPKLCALPIWVHDEVCWSLGQPKSAECLALHPSAPQARN